MLSTSLRIYFSNFCCEAANFSLIRVQNYNFEIIYALAAELIDPKTLTGVFWLCSSPESSFIFFLIKKIEIALL